jgi:hypothetical protein
LVNYWGDDAASAVSGFVKGSTADLVAHMLLLGLPVLLTLWFLRKTLKRSSVMLQLFPMVAVATSFCILVVAQLSSADQQKIYSTPIGSAVRPATDVIIAGTAILILIMTIFTFRHRDHAQKHK